VEMDERKVSPPAFHLLKDERLAAVCEWPLFGRLRRDFDVEALAGTAPTVPIIRPVEMTLVPDRVSDFQEVATAMRHALNLCVLLANQRTVVRNSYTLRVCMLEHLFVRVIPLPLPLTHRLVFLYFSCFGYLLLSFFYICMFYYFYVDSFYLCFIG
jgi:hypothetical protein